MNNNREQKLKIAQNLTQSLIARKIHLEDLSAFYFDDDESKQIKKELVKWDKRIEANLKIARSLFESQFKNYSSSEICLLLYMFANVYSTQISPQISSNYFETILRDNPKEIIEINDSLERTGNLFKHIKKTDRQSGNGFILNIRSFTLLNDFLME